MNTARYLRVWIVIMAGLALTACAGAGGGAPVQPAAPAPTAAGGATARVVENTIVKDATFLDKPNPETAESGKDLYAVGVIFEAGSNPYTGMLKLAEVKLVMKDGTTINPLTLTIGPGEKSSVNDLAYFRNVGKGDSTLDFGFGFTGNDMKMSVSFKDSKRDALTLYHGASPTYLTFLFQIPKGAAPASLQVAEFPQMPLE
jgi:hypothetical protein